MTMQTTKLITLSLVLTVTSPLLWAETRNVDNFEQVTYALPYDVEFVPSDEPFVKFEGDQDTIDEVVTEVRGNTLKIYKEKSWFDWSDKDIFITVGYPRISAITLSGSGDGFAESLEADKLALTISGSAQLELEQVVCNDLTISISGSGNINLNQLDADTLSSKIAGSGNVEVGGTVVSQNVSVTGSGDHSAGRLRAQEVEVKVLGSGDAEVWALASLNASVTGSGDIAYYGEPQVSERVTGSGDIKHRGKAP